MGAAAQAVTPSGSIKQQLDAREQDELRQKAFLQAQAAQVAAENRRRAVEEEEIGGAVHVLEERLQGMDEAKKTPLTWRQRLEAVSKTRAGGSSLLCPTKMSPNGVDESGSQAVDATGIVEKDGVIREP